jgi:hypothetical protein
MDSQKVQAFNKTAISFFDYLQQLSPKFPDYVGELKENRAKYQLAFDLFPEMAITKFAEELSPYAVDIAERDVAKLVSEIGKKAVKIDWCKVWDSIEEHEKEIIWSKISSLMMLATLAVGSKPAPTNSSSFEINGASIDMKELSGAVNKVLPAVMQMMGLGGQDKQVKSRKVAREMSKPNPAMLQSPMDGPIGNRHSSAASRARMRAKLEERMAKEEHVEEDEYEEEQVPTSKGWRL